MKFHISHLPNGVLSLKARAETGDYIGDMVEVVTPDHPRYKELLALGEGEHEIGREKRPTSARDALSKRKE